MAGAGVGITNGIMGNNAIIMWQRNQNGQYAACRKRRKIAINIMWRNRNRINNGSVAMAAQ
jgi:hypothetical protein